MVFIGSFALHSLFQEEKKWIFLSSGMLIMFKKFVISNQGTHSAKMDIWGLDEPCHESENQVDYQLFSNISKHVLGD